MKNRNVLIVCNIIAAICFGITTFYNINDGDTTMAIITGIASVASFVSLILNLKNK